MLREKGLMDRETIIELAEEAMEDTVDWYAAQPRQFDRTLTGSIIREHLLRFYDRLEQEEGERAAIESERDNIREGLDDEVSK